METVNLDGAPHTGRFIEQGGCRLQTFLSYTTCVPLCRDVANRALWFAMAKDIRALPRSVLCHRTPRRQWPLTRNRALPVEDPVRARPTPVVTRGIEGRSLSAVSSC